MEEKLIDGKLYRLVTIRGRSKWVSSDGDLINPYRKQCVGIKLNKYGYPCTGGSVPVHLYVAHGWVDGYFEGAEVNHKDFDRTNYNSYNLEWVTHEENIKYSLKYNLEVWNKSKQGTNNGRATFTENDIRDIRKYYDNGLSIADIIRIYFPNLVHAKEYRNIHSNISSICRRKTWKNIL